MKPLSVAFAIFAGCSQAQSPSGVTPPSLHAAAPSVHAAVPLVRAQVVAPPATPPAERQVQTATGTPLPWLGNASPPRFGRLLWRRSVTAPQDAPAGADIAVSRSTLIFAAAGSITAYAYDSSKRWTRMPYGTHIVLAGETLFASVANRVNAIDVRSGAVRWSARPCGTKPPNFIAAGITKVAIGCDGAPPAQSDVVGLDMRSGRRSYSLPYARMGYSNYRLEPAAQDWVWIAGDFSGAYSGVQATLVNISTGKPISQHIDAELSGRSGSRIYLNDRGTMPGSRLDVYEPVRLSWVDLFSSAESAPVVYAPDPQRWPGHEEDSEYALGSAHVVGNDVYVAAGKKLYRYALAAPPDAQHPQLVAEDLAEPPVYIGSRAFLRRLNPASGTVLRVVTAASPWASSRRPHANVSLRHFGSSLVGMADFAIHPSAVSTLFEADANTSAPGYGGANEIVHTGADLVAAPDRRGNVRVLSARGEVGAIPAELVTACRCLPALARRGSMLFVLETVRSPDSRMRYDLLALQM